VSIRTKDGLHDKTEYYVKLQLRRRGLDIEPLEVFQDLGVLFSAMGCNDEKLNKGQRGALIISFHTPIEAFN
jgi:hypothetical protein